MKKNYFSLLFICIVICLFSITPNKSFGQTIWDSGTVVFTKTAVGQIDMLTANTHLTRGSDRPIYNNITESSASGCSWTPGNTQWAYGNLANWSTLTYKNLFELNSCNPPSMVNQPMVLHLLTEDIYLQITFTFWQQRGGNFTYTRSAAKSCKSISTTNATICSGSTYSFNGTTYNSTGTFTATLTNAAGCDSTAKLNLTVKPLPPTSTISVQNSLCSSTLTLVNGVPGVTYDYYEGSFNLLPDFNTLTPVKTGILPNFDISQPTRLKDDDFAFRFKGSINITTAGNYTFYTESDDGSKLYIDGNLIVNNDGTHGPQWEQGSVSLSQGNHSIEVTFFELGGGEVLNVEYEGPGISRQSIQNSVLSTTVYSSALWTGGSTPNSFTNTFTSPGIYTVTPIGLNGCTGTPQQVNVSIGTLPSITGAISLCVSSTNLLSNTETGGTWQSMNNKASINSSGLVTATNAGTAVIKYSKVSGGCSVSTTTTFVVSKNTLQPSIAYAPGTINPQRGNSGGFCPNKTFTVVGTPSGGFWSSTGVITVHPTTGVVNTGAVAGAATLTYTFVNASGCSNSNTFGLG